MTCFTPPYGAAAPAATLNSGGWEMDACFSFVRTASSPKNESVTFPPPLTFALLFSWSAKLYLTPSNSVLLTAIALIGVCVFILIIIGVLHWQEKVSAHTHTLRHDGVVNIGLFLVIYCSACI